MKTLCSVLLIFFSILIQFPASAAPARVTTFKLAGTGTLSATFSWSTPKPATGASLVANDVRCNTVTITSNNWAKSPVVAVGLPIPMTPGQVQTGLVTGFKASTKYYCAMKSSDTKGWSTMSNVVTLTTSLVGNVSVINWTAPAQPGIMGYRICKRLIPNAYSVCEDVGNVTTYTYTGLPFGQNCFVVSTYFDNRILKAVSWTYTDPAIPYLVGSENTGEVCQTF